VKAHAWPLLAERMRDEVGRGMRYFMRFIMARRRRLRYLCLGHVENEISPLVLLCQWFDVVVEIIGFFKKRLIFEKPCNFN